MTKKLIIFIFSIIIMIIGTLFYDQYIILLIKHSLTRWLFLIPASYLLLYPAVNFWVGVLTDLFNKKD